MYKQYSPGVYFLDQSIAVGQDQIRFLADQCRINSMNMSRLCLHSDHDSKLMSMLIYIKDKFIYPPHKHSWKDESYTILHGTCCYEEYSDKGQPLLQHYLKKGDSFLNNRSRFHAIIPSTDELAFLEVTTGPFTTQRPLFL